MFITILYYLMHLFLNILGGCGAIFEVFISSEEFKGLTIVKQHQLINQVYYHSL